MEKTLQYTGTLMAVTCWCGIHYAIPAELHKAMKASTRQACHCPLGHSMVYRESDVDLLKRQLENAEAFGTSMRDQLEATERSLRAQRGVTTKLKNRIAAGVCPCCHRSFQNVRRHMAGQHPDFASEEQGGA